MKFQIIRLEAFDFNLKPHNSRFGYIVTKMNELSKQLKDKSDDELAEYMAGWKPETGKYILCEMEFKRRQSRPNEIRGWISLGLSIIAIVISVLALIVNGNA